jgi:hypothetical protein
MIINTGGHVTFNGGGQLLPSFLGLITWSLRKNMTTEYVNSDLLSIEVKGKQLSFKGTGQFLSYSN